MGKVFWRERKNHQLNYYQQQQSPYADIQVDKNHSAQALADKASAFLDENPFANLTLVFHSQGSDIGQRALDRLTSYKRRIHVVTIGGMVDIPDAFAKRVVNFDNQGDMISQFAKKVFSKPLPATKVTMRGTSHDSSAYLSSSPVQRTIKVLSRPNVYA